MRDEADRVDYGTLRGRRENAYLVEKATFHADSERVRSNQRGIRNESRCETLQLYKITVPPLPGSL